MMPSEQPKEDQERSEIDYTLGSRMAWLAMLGECLRQLGYDDSEAQRVKWVKEREATVSMLRMVCKEHGDNDWPNDLHLADVIEKHLANHIESLKDACRKYGFPDGTAAGDEIADHL